MRLYLWWKLDGRLSSTSQVLKQGQVTEKNRRTSSETGAWEYDVIGSCVFEEEIYLINLQWTYALSLLMIFS